MEITILYLIVTWIIGLGILRGTKKIDGLPYDNIVIVLAWVLCSWCAVPFAFGTWYAKVGRRGYEKYDIRGK
jgi:hypothetical protein